MPCKYPPTHNVLILGIEASESYFRAVTSAAAQFTPSRTLVGDASENLSQNGSQSYSRPLNVDEGRKNADEQGIGQEHVEDGI